MIADGSDKVNKLTAQSSMSTCITFHEKLTTLKYLYACPMVEQLNAWQIMWDVLWETIQIK